VCAAGRPRIQRLAGNNVARDFGEPVFDLVEPGTISGGVMQGEVWMVGKEAIDELGFVGGEVIYDEADLLAGELCGDDLLEEAGKLLAGVAAGSACDDLATFGLEGSIKGKGAVTEILEPMALSRPGESGRTGSRRSRAWLAVFSSTQKTAAWAGGVISPTLRKKRS
jgi:hypothetical protein